MRYERELNDYKIRLTELNAENSRVNKIRSKKLKYRIFFLLPKFEYLFILAIKSITSLIIYKRTF